MKKYNINTSFNFKFSILNLLIIVLLFSSCKEYIDYELEEAERKIVLNGFITPDETVKINITKSLSSAEKDVKLEYLENLSVQLFEEGNLVSNLEYDNLGFYKSDFIPTANKNYIVKATGSNFSDVEASTFLKKECEIRQFDVNLSFERNEYTDYDGNIYYDSELSGNVEITINDNNDDNYYLIELYKKDTVEWFDYENNVVFDTLINNTIYTYPNSSYDQNSVNIYSDSKFDGHIYSNEFNNSETMSFDLSVNIYNYSITDGNLTNNTLFLNVYTFNKDYYQYAKSYSNYQDNEGNPFTAAVNVYSNVKNGLGLFTAYSVTKDSIEVNIN